jgi:hypothetical protein
MAKSSEEAKLAKAAKAKATRALQAEQRDQAMIALAEKRGKLWVMRSDENAWNKTRLADSPSAVGTGEGSSPV